MRSINRKGLPRVLVLDDQFGRCGLGKKFRKRVTPEVFAGYEADRKNLCLNYGLVDVTGDSHVRRPTEVVAEAIFCPAQRWDDGSQRIENTYDTARALVERGWSFEDGTRWALVILDLRFVYGPLNTFGDPQEGSLFGAEVLLPRLRSDFGVDLPIVVLSSTRKDENNPIVRRLGALDFIQRVPGHGSPPDEARAMLQRALFTHGLTDDPTGMVIGNSLATLKMLRQARRGAMSARNVLLLGETGTGKGLLAEYIHRMSSRAAMPFETFHAAHRPGDLQADELFGHWKGAFTGAHGDSAGIWERADGGTVFIDEVADIDVRVQQALMQPIEERKVRRVGTPPGEARDPKPVDVLVVLATNRDVQSAAASGTLKSDFLNRINAFTIEVPPLRDRREDIPLIARGLTAAVAPHWHGEILPDAMEALIAHDWRNGNVRELRNVLERAIANNPSQDITATDVTDASTIVADSQPKGQEHAPWVQPTSMAEALLSDLEQLTLAEVEDMRSGLPGAFADLLAQALTLALRLTEANGKLNPTAAVRFLLGNPELTTVQAKQFLKRLLVLDTQGKSVLRAFERTGLPGQHGMLRRLSEECRRPRRRKGRRAPNTDRDTIGDAEQ